MKKIITLFIILFFTHGCGYTPLYKNNKSNNLKFHFEIIEENGDTEINNYIISNLNKYLETNQDHKYEIKINTNFTQSGISNNKQGETTAYTLAVNAEFDVYQKNKSNKITLNEKININRSNDTFEQKNYELKIKRDISKIIVDKFINRLLTLE